MFTPDGQSADQTDKIMLLEMWADELSHERATSKQVLFAGMGKPTFPVNRHIIDASLSYWNELKSKGNEAINYGDPRGDESSRVLMASAMSKWYGFEIHPEHILFTSGGAGALRVIFETFNGLYHDGYRVITPFPYYPLYADERHQLHPVDVMNNPGYRLTAQSLQFSIDEAYQRAIKDTIFPKMILLCNPNNPLGTVISEDELIKIADVLRRYPELYIVLDEAYGEMCFTGRAPPSLIRIAPDLKHRVVMLRSATKAFSVAGERMAILIAFDESLMSKCLNKNISNIGHAPRSSQRAYAETMSKFTDMDHQQLISFYQPKVRYVEARLKAMGASMPDPDYKSDGTFYQLGDFSDLFGLEMPIEAERALGKVNTIKTSEELAYYLLFQDSVMMAPASYFGMPKTNGFMRITCSDTQDKLIELMDRLEARLYESAPKRILI